MRVIDMADIIRAMQNETQFVLRCEEVFHDKISSAAASILSAQPQKPFVCLTGQHPGRICGCRPVCEAGK